MEIKVLLYYGEALPPFKHIEKIINKYYKYYLNDKDKEDIKEDYYYEIWIEERYTGLNTRNRQYTLTVPVKKEFLFKLLNIFTKLKGNVSLCKTQHEHPVVHISGKEYEGYCFYLDSGQEKIIFYENYWIKADVKEDTEKVFAKLISSIPR